MFLSVLGMRETVVPPARLQAGEALEQNHVVSWARKNGMVGKVKACRVEIRRQDLISIPCHGSVERSPRLPAHHPVAGSSWEKLFCRTASL